MTIDIEYLGKRRKELEELSEHEAFKKEMERIKGTFTHEELAGMYLIISKNRQELEHKNISMRLRIDDYLNQLRTPRNGEKDKNENTTV